MKKTQDYLAAQRIAEMIKFQYVMPGTDETKQATLTNVRTTSLVFCDSNEEL